MILADKDKVKIEFIVAKNKRISLPCIALITPYSVSKGLMNIREMSRSVGAFFVFDKAGLHKFWMKDTYIPLDIIWISEEGIVSEIIENATPHDTTSIGGNIPSKYAIEVVAGWVFSNNIRKGMRIKVSKLITEQKNFSSYLAWIDPKGKIHTGFHLHEDFARDYFGAEVSEDDFLTYSMRLIKNNWVRQSNCTFQIKDFNNITVFGIVDGAREYNCSSMNVEEVDERGYRSALRTYSSSEDIISELEKI